MNRVTVFIIVLMLTNIGLADDLKYKNSLFFYFHDNIEFAYQRYLNSSSSLKFNILFRGRSTDIKTEADIERSATGYQTRQSMIKASGGETSEYFETSIQYVHIIYSIPSFNIYLGAGPLFRYSNYEISDRNEYENLDTSADFIYTKDKIQYIQSGLVGGAYIDYLLSERIGIFGEYKISCSYSWTNRKEEDMLQRIDGRQDKILYDVDSNSWNYKTYNVKFGLLINL